MSSKLEQEERIYEEIKESQITFYLHLNNARLNHFPDEIIKNQAALSRLRRLDLSHNNISSVPSDITILTSLRELWLNNNPKLRTIPASIKDCVFLEVIDISSTNVTDIPPEVCKLRHLHELDWRDTPMANYYLNEHKIESNDINSMMRLCETFLERAELRSQLEDLLVSEHYVRESDNPAAKAVIRRLVESISDAFLDLEEFKIFVRWARKLLPEKLSQIQDQTTVERARSAFLQMHNDTKRQRLSADVEIKLRSFYFDRVTPQEATAMLADIYDHVSDLRDVEFLVKFAAQLLPPRPEDVSGAALWDSICVLQKDLGAKRQASVASLVESLRQLYPEQPVEVVAQKAAEVVASFQKERFATKRELATISRLVAECGRIFPVDFDSATPQAIYNRAQTMFKSPVKTS